MRTSCPACHTIFRVTSEQLRKKAGTVRCGQCQTLFNAFDHLLPASDGGVEQSASESLALTNPEAFNAPAGAREDASEEERSSAAPVMPDLPERQMLDLPPPPSPLATVEALPAEPAATQDAPLQPAAESPPDLRPSEPVPEDAPLPPPEVPADGLLPDSPAVVNDGQPEIREPDPVAALPTALAESQAAGLTSVRSLEELADADLWAKGALESEYSGLEPVVQKGPLWPYVLSASLLALILLLQLLHHYRGDIVRTMPPVGGVYSALGISVPLPRDPSLVSVESSELRFDSARKLFVLSTTLRNRANHRQAWPMIELTLTDVNDRVIARKVFPARDYLPLADQRKAFAARSDTALRLWLDPGEQVPAGYRLYLFYP